MGINDKTPENLDIYFPEHQAIIFYDGEKAVSTHKVVKY